MRMLNGPVSCDCTVIIFFSRYNKTRAINGRECHAKDRVIVLVINARVIVIKHIASEYFVNTRE